MAKSSFILHLEKVAREVAGVFQGVFTSNLILGVTTMEVAGVFQGVLTSNLFLGVTTMEVVSVFKGVLTRSLISGGSKFSRRAAELKNMSLPQFVKDRSTTKLGWNCSQSC